MKKVMSSIVAAIVAVAFAGVCFAAEPKAVMPAGHPATAAPAEVMKEEAAPAKPAKKKKIKKAKKVVKPEVKKEEVAPVAPAAPAVK